MKKPRKTHKKPFCGKRGTVTLFIVFIITSLVILLIASVIAPMGALFSTEAYKAGEMILNETAESLNGISDATVRAEVNATIQSGLAATQDNIDVSVAIYKYGWLVIIGLTSLIVFLFTRRLVEYGQTGLI